MADPAVHSAYVDSQQSPPYLIGEAGEHLSKHNAIVGTPTDQFGSHIATHGSHDEWSFSTTTETQLESAGTTYRRSPSNRFFSHLPAVEGSSNNHLSTHNDTVPPVMPSSTNQSSTPPPPAKDRPTLSTIAQMPDSSYASAYSSISQDSELKVHSWTELDLPETQSIGVSRDLCTAPLDVATGHRQQTPSSTSCAASHEQLTLKRSRTPPVPLSPARNKNNNIRHERTNSVHSNCEVLQASPHKKSRLEESTLTPLGNASQTSSYEPTQQEPSQINNVQQIGKLVQTALKPNPCPQLDNHSFVLNRSASSHNHFPGSQDMSIQISTAPSVAFSSQPNPAGAMSADAPGSVATGGLSSVYGAPPQSSDQIPANRESSPAREGMLPQRPRHHFDSSKSEMIPSRHKLAEICSGSADMKELQPDGILSQPLSLIGTSAGPCPAATFNNNTFLARAKESLNASQLSQKPCESVPAELPPSQLVTSEDAGRNLDADGMDIPGERTIRSPNTPQAERRASVNVRQSPSLQHTQSMPDSPGRNTQADAQAEGLRMFIRHEKIYYLATATLTSMDIVRLDFDDGTFSEVPLETVHRSALSAKLLPGDVVVSVAKSQPSKAKNQRFHVVSTQTSLSEELHPQDTVIVQPEASSACTSRASLAAAQSTHRPWPASTTGLLAGPHIHISSRSIDLSVLPWAISARKPGSQVMPKSHKHRHSKSHLLSTVALMFTSIDSPADIKSSQLLATQHGATILDDITPLAGILSGATTPVELMEVSSLQSILLIARTSITTPKYLKALALGIPCVSAGWVTDCVATRIILDWKPYALGAGHSQSLGSSVVGSQSAVLARQGSTLATLQLLQRELRIFAGKRLVYLHDISPAGHKRAQLAADLFTQLGGVVDGTHPIVKKNACFPPLQNNTIIICDHERSSFGKSISSLLVDHQMYTWDWLKDCIILGRLI